MTDSFGSTSVVNRFSQKTDLENLQNFYQFRNRSDILGFLKVNPFLIPILQEGQVKINHHFPTSTAFLECIQDPKISDSQLAIYLTREIENTEEAMERIENLYDDWLSEQKTEVRCKLYVRFNFF
jgi:hypothetical protein